MVSLTACCALDAVILLEFAVIHMLKPLSKHVKTVQHFTVCGTQSFLTSSVEFWRNDRNAKAKTKGVKNICPVYMSWSLQDPIAFMDSK